MSKPGARGRDPLTFHLVPLHQEGWGGGSEVGAGKAFSVEEAQSSRGNRVTGECAQDIESSSSSWMRPGNMKSHVFIPVPLRVHKAESGHSHTFANESGFST